MGERGTGQRVEPVEPYAMTYEKMALHVGCSRTRLTAWVNEGRIRAVKAGRRTLLITDTVRAVIDDLPTVRD